MKDKIVSESVTTKKKNWVYLVLGLMIAVQLGMIVYGFAYKKEDCHSDELWSYGYANSYYQGSIYIDNQGNEVNINEWTSSQVLRDYLTVNKGERFKYDSVYQNQINDLSPPFHSMVLHTICSFFPEKFSLWYSFSINIVSFIVCMVFLFKITRLLKGDWFALCCCGVYGFSLGARDTYVYLRMYAMCTAFLMIIIYNMICYLQKNKKYGTICNSNLVVMIIVAFLSFLTNYYMVAVIGIITFLCSIILLFQKRIKALFAFGITMLGTLGVSIAAFPSLVRVPNIQSERVAEQATEMMNYDFVIRFKILLDFVMYKMFGIHVSLSSSAVIPIIIGCLVFALIVISPLLYLLRDTKLIKNGVRKIVFCCKHVKGIIKYLWRRINWIYIVLFLTIILQIIVVGETSNVYGMGVYEDRYIMYLYPIVAIVGIAFVFWIIRLVLKKKMIKTSIIILGIIGITGINLNNRLNYTVYYFTKGTDGKNTIEECVKNSDCIYVTDSTWLLTAMTYKMLDINDFFMVERKNYDKYTEEYKKRLNNGSVYLLLDNSFHKMKDEKTEIMGYNIVITNYDEMKEELDAIYNELLDYYDNLVPETEMIKISEDKVFGRGIEIYLLNP